jgi:hypothetical protein
MKNQPTHQPSDRTPHQDHDPTAGNGAKGRPRLLSLDGSTPGPSAAPFTITTSTQYMIPRLALLTTLMILVTGCTAPRPLKGGKALTTATHPGAVAQTLVQGDSPSQPSTQSQETLRVRTYTLPPGSRIEEPRLQTDATGHNWTNVQNIIVSAPTPVVERQESHATTELGAAQKDTAHDVAAKLSSLKSITWVGLALFVFGLASLFWPPLQTIIGSFTTSAAITAGGLALIVLPTLLVGNELLILAGVSLVVGAWFLAHRHGHLRGQLAAATTPHLSTTNPQRNPRPPGTPPSAPAPSPNL